MEKLLTQQDLADRWQVSVRAVENWRKEGILQPAKGIPAIRFTIEHVTDLEGTKFEKFSPMERRKLEREIEELKKQNEMFKGILSNVLAETSKIINF